MNTCVSMGVTVRHSLTYSLSRAEVVFLFCFLSCQGRAG